MACCPPAAGAGDCWRQGRARGLCSVISPGEPASDPSRSPFLSLFPVLLPAAVVGLSVCLSFYLSFFLGQPPQHMEVVRLEVQSEP